MGQEIMVFRPEMEEFEHLSNYIQHMEYKGANLAGVAKVCNKNIFVA